MDPAPVSNKFRRVPSVIRYLLVLLVIIPGVVVLLEPFLRGTFFQASSSLFAVTPKLAWSFVLAGSGLIAAMGHRHLWVSILAGSIVVIASHTLFAYPFLDAFDLSKLPENQGDLSGMPPPGAMSPMAAFVFLLIGFFLFLTRWQKKIVRLSLIGALVTGLGLYVSLDYQAGLENTFWDRLIYMDVYSSLGIILLGISMVLWCLTGKADAPEVREYWSIVFVTVELVMLVFIIWCGLKDQENRHIREIVQSRTNNFQEVFDLYLESEVTALERMGARWSHRGGMPRAEWEAEAAAYEQQLAIFQAIEWVDSSYHVRWIMPLKGNEAAQGLNLGFEPRRKQALDAARNSGITTISRTVNLVQGGQGVLIYVPLFVGGRFDGFILGVVRIDKLLAVLPLAAQLRELFYIQIKDGERSVSGIDFDIRPEEVRYSQRATLNLRNTRWQARLIPTNTLLKQTRTSLPVFVLVSGLLIIALLLYFYYLRRQARKQTAQLQHEMNRRVIVEQSLVKSGNELQSIMDSTQEGFYGLNLQGEITFANPAACRMLGFSEDELLGRNQHTLIQHSREDGSPYPWEASHIYSALTDFAVKDINDEVFWCKDGSSIPVEFTCSPLRNNHYAIIGAVVVFRDVRQRRQHDQAVARYTRDLERSNSDLNDFAYIASHDLKAPLRGISQLINWLEEDVGDNLGAVIPAITKKPLLPRAGSLQDNFSYAV